MIPIDKCIAGRVFIEYAPIDILKFGVNYVKGKKNKKKGKNRDKVASTNQYSSLSQVKSLIIKKR